MPAQKEYLSVVRVIRGHTRSLDNVQSRVEVWRLRFQVWHRVWALGEFMV